MRAKLIFVWQVLLVLLLLCRCVPEEEKQHVTGYVEALQMIHADTLFGEGLRGNGVKIGVMDVGFAALNLDTSLAHVRRNGQIAVLRDMIPGNPVSIFRYSHGTQVLKYMAGIYPDDTVYKGSLARDATYFLIRPASGAGAKEDCRNDEMNIDTAFMILDSMGVRLVNMSMGFWNEYTREDENYKPEQMDGKTTAITRICQKWAERGMIIVNSAGNTGEYSWRVIWAPADAPGVISVGGDRFTDVVFKASYSGTGNPDVPFVKPDLIAYTPWGTSFSAPVVTGLIACMLQKDSTLTREEVMDILHRSGSLYPYPNDFVGYGLPDARKILCLMANRDTVVSHVKVINTLADRIEIPTAGEKCVVFEKSDPVRVSRQMIHEGSGGQLVVKRKGNIPRTTVAVGLDRAYEIFWESQ